MALNGAQQRSVSATFAHVSKLLEDVERLAHAEPNGFDRERSDLTAEEARRLIGLAAEVRARMLEALEALGVPGPEPDGSARWNARTLLLYAGIALSELEGTGLRAYGELADQDAERVTSLVRDLRRVVEREQAQLRED
jgi:hypothetical protein